LVRWMMAKFHPAKATATPQAAKMKTSTPDMVECRPVWGRGSIPYVC